MCLPHGTVQKTELCQSKHSQEPFSLTLDPRACPHLRKSLLQEPAAAYISAIST